MNHQKFIEVAHKISTEHGFWDKMNTSEHCMMLVVTEVSEMVEADRKERHADLAEYERRAGVCPESFDGTLPEIVPEWFKDTIKDTLEDELADIAIRLYDLAGALGVVFEKYKDINYNREFDKYDFCENAFALTKGLCDTRFHVEKRIAFGIRFVTIWAEHMGVNLEKHIMLKMAFNATRGAMHGKRY